MSICPPEITEAPCIPPYIDDTNKEALIAEIRSISPTVQAREGIENRTICNARAILSAAAETVRNYDFCHTQGGVVYLKSEDEQEQEIISGFFYPVLNNIVACFYTNPYLTTAILRSGVKGKHYATLKEFQGDSITCEGKKTSEFIQDFMHYSSYDLSFDDSQKDTLPLLGGLLGIVRLSDALAKSSSDIHDYYSPLPKEKFYSIVYEVYFWSKKYTNVFIKDTLSPNFYFYKRLIQDHDIPPYIKSGILEQRDASKAFDSSLERLRRQLPVPNDFPFLRKHEDTESETKREVINLLDLVLPPPDIALHGEYLEGQMLAQTSSEGVEEITEGDTGLSYETQGAIIESRNDIPANIKEKYSITDAEIKVAHTLLDQIQESITNPYYRPDDGSSQYEASIIGNSLVIFGDIYLGSIRYDRVLQYIVPLFYINPHLSTAVIRGLCEGSHYKTAQTFQTLDPDFIKEFLEYASYNVDIAHLDEVDTNVETLYQVSGGGFLTTLLRYDGGSGLGAHDYHIHDLYSSLPNKKFYSIVAEMYHWGITMGKPSVYSGSCYNFYFWKRLILDTNIPGYIKDSLLAERFHNQVCIDPGLHTAIADNNNAHPDIIFLTSSYSQKDSLVEGTSDISHIGAELMALPTVQILGQAYAVQGYRRLLELDDSAQKAVFLFIIEKDFSLGIAFLRNAGKHVVNKKLIGDFDDTILLRIFREGLLIPTELLTDENFHTFMDIDQFSIVKVMSLLPFSKTIPLFNKLRVDEIIKVLTILFYLRNEKEYTTKNFRHLCKEQGVHKGKIRKAMGNIQAENLHIWMWLHKELFQDEVFFENDYDYNLLMGGDARDCFGEVHTGDPWKVVEQVLHNFINEGVLLERISPLFSEAYLNILASCAKMQGKSEIQVASIVGRRLPTIDEKQVLAFISNAISELGTIGSKNPDKITMTASCLRLLKTLSLFLGKQHLKEGDFCPLSPYKAQSEVQGKVKIIKDYKQLDTLHENDIVVLEDYPTTYPEIKCKPKAIIMSKKAGVFTHSVAFAEKEHTPVYHLEQAEYYLDAMNGLDIQITPQGTIILNRSEYFIAPYEMDRIGNKYNGVQGSSLHSVMVSGQFYYGVLNDYYGDILSLDFQEIASVKNQDYNVLVSLPFEELRQLFDTISQPYNYQELSEKACQILDEIHIKDEHITKFIGADISFPLALRSDFLSEDIDRKRSPGQKESYLNIRNREELKIALLNMLKQDFSPQALQYKLSHNIYPAYCTFGAILQEMAIHTEEDAEDLISGVVEVSILGGQINYNSQICIGLNLGVSDGGIQQIYTSSLSGEEQEMLQSSYYTLDNSNGGTKQTVKEVSLPFTGELQTYIEEELGKYIGGDLSSQSKIQFEFSVSGIGKKLYHFMLLQKNIIDT